VLLLNRDAYSTPYCQTIDDDFGYCLWCIGIHPTAASYFHVPVCDCAYVHSPKMFAFFLSLRPTAMMRCCCQDAKGIGIDRDRDRDRIAIRKSILT